MEPKKPLQLGRFQPKPQPASRPAMQVGAPQQPPRKWNGGQSVAAAAKAGDAPATPQAGASPGTAVQKLVARERRAQMVLANIENLPSLPAVVTEILALANNPDSCASDFEGCVRKDQALTAKVLKLVNSSFFGLNSKVNTISRSVVVLGYKTLKSVVLAASTSKLLDRNISVYKYDKGGLWMQALSAAAAARYLGGKVFKMSVDDAEELFVAGLLHNIGKIVIAPVLSAHEEEVGGRPDADAPEPVDDMERRVVGIDHTEAGSKMLSKWNLSKRLVHSLQYKWNDIALPPEDRQFNNVAHLALQLCLSKRIGITDDYAWPTEVDPGLIAALDMDPETVPEQLEKLNGLLLDIGPLLKSLRD